MRLSIPSLAVALAFSATATAQQARPTQVASPGTVGTPTGITIASENDDLSALLYTDSGDQNVYVRVSDGRGLTWSAPIRLDDDTTNAPKDSSRASLVVDNTYIYAAWLDERNGLNDDVYFNASPDGGATWLPANIRLDNSFAAGAADVTDFRIASSGNDIVAVIATDDGDEVLTLTWSTDGGVTWEDAIDVTTHNGTADVDDFDLAVSGDEAYIAWRDNSLNGSDDTIFLSIFEISNETFSAQDVDLSPNMITDGGDADDEVEISVDDEYVAVVFQADGLGTSAEQARVNMSSDFGQTWTGDKQVGQYDNAVIGHDVDGATVLVEDGMLAVAWRDDRSGQNEVYCAVGFFSTGNFISDQQCSASSAGTGTPRLAGEFDGEALAVAWASTPGRTIQARHFRGGLWTDRFTVSDNPGGDVSDARLAWNDHYDNFLALWNSTDTGVDVAYVGGFRPQQLQTGDFIAGQAAQVTVSGFNASTDFQVVASGSLGNLILPDARNLGLTFDNILQTTLNLSQLQSTTDVAGAGATTPLSIPANLAGMPLFLVAATSDPIDGIIDITDAVRVVVQ